MTRRPQVRLVWEGRTTPLPVPPHQTLFRELWPGDGAGGALFHGDGATVAAVPAHHGVAALVYIDPPFLAGRRFHVSHMPPGAKAPLQLPGFSDQWDGGTAEYLAAMERLAVAAWRMVRDNGVMVVHIDPRAQPYLRVLLDEVLAGGALVNDIVWHYRSGGGTRHSFGWKHDHLLVYTRGDHTFNADAVRVPYDAVIAASRRDAFHPEGKTCPDVWEIPRPPNHSKEWAGWPTQKPLALMERLLLAFTNPGDLVADLCCGSGTTLVAAAQNGRRWLGADASPLALLACRRRLAGHGPFTVHSPTAPHRGVATAGIPPAPADYTPPEGVAAMLSRRGHAVRLVDGLPIEEGANAPLFPARLGWLAGWARGRADQVGRTFHVEAATWDQAAAAGSAGDVLAFDFLGNTALAPPPAGC